MKKIIQLPDTDYLKGQQVEVNLPETNGYYEYMDQLYAFLPIGNIRPCEVYYLICIGRNYMFSIDFIPDYDCAQQSWINGQSQNANGLFLKKLAFSYFAGHITMHKISDMQFELKKESLLNAYKIDFKEAI